MLKLELNKLRPYKSWLTSAGITIAIALWLASGHIGGGTKSYDSEQNPNVASAPRTSVRVRHQTAVEVTRNITVNGRTAPARIVELNAETDGRVVSIGVERGDRFDAGDVIVKLDQRDRRARLLQAEATVKQRELEFEDRQVEVGDFVKLGDPIATIVDDRTLVVSASIAEYEAHFVRKGSPGTAKLATGQTVSGTIRYIAPVATEATRTFDVELEIDNADGLLRAGMTAELVIPAETIYAHKVSPSLLTLDNEGNLGIKVVNESGIVEFHSANIAMSSSEGVWISGLPYSATIITVGQGFVNEGAVVDAIPEDEIETAVAIKSGQLEQ